MGSIAGFDEIRIVDNFYQTSSFFPMPVIAITTLDDEGNTNVGPYSLCFPYYIAGKSYYAMILESRNSSNTSINLLKRGRCALNFLTDGRRYMKECVNLGFPGETTSEKMEGCIFDFADGLRASGDPDGDYPKIITDSYQVFECEWDRELEDAGRFTYREEYEPPYNDFNGITSEFGAHFILEVKDILMKPKYRDAIIGGVKARSFPRVPVDYGYRDNTKFWFANFRRPWSARIPKSKGMQANTVWYAANRIDPDVKFTLEACEKLTRVPRVFLNKALQGCVDWAKENSIVEILPEHMDMIRDKRTDEKAG